MIILGRKQYSKLGVLKLGPDKVPEAENCKQGELKIDGPPATLVSTGPALQPVRLLDNSRYLDVDSRFHSCSDVSVQLLQLSITRLMVLFSRGIDTAVAPP